MNTVTALFALLGASLSASCAGSPSSTIDPQQPAPPPASGQPLAASQIVICPEGSTYNPDANNCIATGAISPQGEGPGESLRMRDR
jgi:hypothetical protein